MAREEKIALSMIPFILLIGTRAPLEGLQGILPLLLLYGGLAAAGATVTLLLDKQVNIATRMKTAVAGTILGVLLGFILRDSNTIPEILREVLAASCGMFTDLVWRKWRERVIKSDINSIS